MVCPACKGNVHDAQPKDCKGGTWCDCLHRLPIEVVIEQAKLEGATNE